MSYFMSKSLSQVRNSSGKKYTKFQILKGHDGVINQIKGESNDGNVFHIQHNVKKRNNKTGLVLQKHKVFKIKSSDLQNLIKESHSSKTKQVSTKKDSVKKTIKVKSGKSLKKDSSKSVKKMTIIKKPTKKVSQSLKKTSPKKTTKKLKKVPTKK